MNQQHYKLLDIAHLVKGELSGQEDFIVTGLASLDAANESQISFVNGHKYLSQASVSNAGILIITSDLQQELPQFKQFIIVDNPYLAFAQLTHAFEIKDTRLGIEDTAKIHSSAVIADTAYIGHYAVIGENCVIGDGTRIQSHVKIDRGVEIGKNCFIDSHATITGFSKIGNHVRIHANTVIGGEGFGFAPYQGKWHRIAQLGSVKIGNHVRIGSNCSIDRGALDDTILADGVVIDNLVQIAHNVHIGENTAIAANTGIAGSTVIGKNCVLAGACGISGHLKITDNVTLTGMSMVTKNILDPGVHSSGTGSFESKQWRKMVVGLRQLADVPLTKLVKRLDHIQTQIESIESTLKMRK
ncbi:UDP-3-O-(3-hydroxymyristoyl)glucosamine N-acyltransferase [Acinetobacter sp. B5B]|uniref:UDP-3-O-(3-hydroxymyristoyl)glucosamine N-acyltransferase n=1 Tax=Acinetobacter baretiae TaxID=2605383 RepID=UPI0018C2EAED|nr:UDP-3-O-(3-hydroxymyristoyl)glucosamine N-acyltransferase [Acinetobacter baretiae]MBF7682484.1 UDP-3-O-(3-hydroxymyristoyl)glucosamine N-acyltransferase [Acinetobacter baretiae]MBF7685249.1 UDP-3-O-(3-hydroxymyristoyl)glucosamine N-acyltransferase [Acinetobacter baretiae]